MNEQWHEFQPTPELVEKVRKAERAFANEINLLSRERIPVACILTALSTTITDLITTQAGPEAVVPWFEKSVRVLQELQDPGQPN